MCNPLQKSFFWPNQIPQCPPVFCFGGLITPFELLTHNPQFTFGFAGHQNFTIVKNVSSFCGHVQFGEVSKPAV